MLLTQSVVLAQAVDLAPIIQFVVAQPLGVALLLVLLWAFATDKIVSGARLAKAEARIEKLEERIQEWQRAAFEGRDAARIGVDVIEGVRRKP